MKNLLVICALASLCLPEILLAQVEAPPQISLEINRSKKKKDGEGDAADFDDKAQRIKLTVKIINSDFREFKGLKCTVTLVGEVMDDDLRLKKDDVYIVLDRQNFTFNLEKALNTEIETKPISVRFDESNSARFGARYLGYVVSIFDANGKRIISETDKTRILSDFTAVEALKVLAPFGPKLENRSNVSHTVIVE